METTTGRPSRRALLGAGAGAGAMTALGLVTGQGSAHAAAGDRYFVSWNLGVLSWGSHSGTRQDGNRVIMSTPSSLRYFRDPIGGRTDTYEQSIYTTNLQPIRINGTELIASWDVLTPGRSFVEVQARVRDELGRISKWFTMGRWCQALPSEGGEIARHSGTDQTDEVATVATDTLVMRNGHTFNAVQLRVVMLRPRGATYTPALYRVAGIASREATVAVAAAPGPGRGITLPVPTYSQETHRDHYPQWGGGGEAWCSATSTAMVIDYWGRTPTSTELSGIYAHADRQVDYSAGRCYDHAYKGTGNWAFNTAYAATRGLDTFVTRLRHLGEAEHFIAARIPVVIATSFQSWEMTGAGYSTAGHLMVIVGFTSTGDVVLNDPASGMLATNSRVRVTYKRAEVERAWARSGHTAYIIRRPDVALPPRLWQPNW